MRSNQEASAGSSTTIVLARCLNFLRADAQLALRPTKAWTVPNMQGGTAVGFKARVPSCLRHQTDLVEACVLNCSSGKAFRNDGDGTNINSAAEESSERERVAQRMGSR